MKVGDKVEHKLSKDWLLVLKVDGDEITCRTKSFDIVKFFEFELQVINK